MKREKKYNYEFSKTREKGEIMVGMGNAVHFGEEEGSQKGSVERARESALKSTPESRWTT